MSFLETVVILVVAVVVLGPNRLPEVARKLGRLMGMLRQAGDEFKRQLMMMDQQLESSAQEATQDLDALLPEDEAQVLGALPEEGRTEDAWIVPPMLNEALEKAPVAPVKEGADGNA